MNYNDVRKNENKGFSLVELIVVIAIMAVMTAVLAPSLLGYVEKSRAQKDASAMGEVSNAIQIAMSDEHTFNEVLKYSCYGNKSCYVDATCKDKTGESDGFYVLTKKANNSAATDSQKAAQWMLNDDARRDDEIPYTTTGSMRGVTITWTPEFDVNNGTYTFVMDNGRVNNIMNDSTNASGTAENPQAYTWTADTTLGGPGGEGDKGMSAGSRGEHYLAGAVNSTVGSRIPLSSKTYRNSDYTVFIRIGATGGNSAGGDAIKVYGQWNGTNLNPPPAE